MPASSEISKKIKEIRENNDLSQERFGKKLGLSGKTISAYETGKCQPALRVLEEISRVYDAPFIHIKASKKFSLEKKLDTLKISILEIEDLLKESVAL